MRKIVSATHRLLDYLVTLFKGFRYSAHHQENQLYKYIIWYLLLCIGDWYAGQGYQAVAYKA
jgi:hypothetical protein